MIQWKDTTEIDLNEFLKIPPQNPEQKSYWFSTPEDPGDSTTYTPFKQRIYNELLDLRALENLNPQENETPMKSFLSNFEWPAQHSAQKNDNKSKKSSLIIREFLPDIVPLIAQIVNSK